MNTQRTPAGVFLTYAAAQSGDGLGAQAQRLMGLFGASRHLGLGYVHTPIAYIEMNPGDPHTSYRDRESYLYRVNELFALPSDIPARPQRTIQVNSLTTARVRYLQLRHRIARSIGQQVLVEMPFSLPWSDQFPNAYSHAARIIRNRIDVERNHDVFRIDVHIRRAVAPKLGGDGKPYDRYVPTAWYQEVLRQMIVSLETQSIPFVLRIHTDIPNGRWKVPDDTTPGTLEMWRRHNFVDDQGFLVDMSENLQREFENFGPLEIATGWDPIDAIKSMTTANALIMCASSLSYVAGLLRGEQLTIAPSFFHTPLNSWLLVPNAKGKELRYRILARLISQQEGKTHDP